MRILSFPITFGSLIPPGSSGRKDLAARCRPLTVVCGAGALAREIGRLHTWRLTNLPIVMLISAATRTRVSAPHLLHDLADRACAYRVTPFAAGKTQAFLRAPRLQ